MLNKRVIPVLLLKNNGLFKGVQFANHRYVGDPINTVKIFNEKEVDELVLLDIEATKDHRQPNYKLISDIATEAFMPLAYGGGLSKPEQVEQLFKIGIEKAVINSAAYSNPEFISDLSKIAGSQSIVVSIDVKTNSFGRYEVYVVNGQARTGLDPVDYAKKMEDLGAGEIILCSIDREGTRTGYDIDLVKQVSSAVNIPVIALGGAGKLMDFSDAIFHGNASAVAAGDYFIFHGSLKAVLITYPSQKELEKVFEASTSDL